MSKTLPLRSRLQCTNIDRHIANIWHMDHWLIYTHISEVYGHKIIAILADWSDKKHYWYHYVGSFPIRLLCDFFVSQQHNNVPYSTEIIAHDVSVVLTQSIYMNVAYGK